jgi:hypothetical protein
MAAPGHLRTRPGPYFYALNGSWGLAFSKDLSRYQQRPGR